MTLAVPKDFPTDGDWPFPDMPEEAYINGILFKKARWKKPYKGVTEQYREASPLESMHLKVSGDKYAIDHVDEVNPDMKNPVAHYFRDTNPVLGPILLGALTLSIASKVIRKLK